MTPQRAEVLAAVAALLAGRDPGHPLRVGVDGICGAGKSVFTRDLAEAVAATGRPVVHVDSDGFHHVRERRHRNRADPARGYYDDAYDLDTLRKRVLEPLGPAGSGEPRRYAVRVHDLASDAVITDETAVAPTDAVVLFDATFLQRGELRDAWDEVVFLTVDEDAAAARGIARDAAALGGTEAARTAYDGRYLAACRLYLAEQDPEGRASIVVEHTDPHAPVLLLP